MLKENKLKENCIRIRIWVKIRGLDSGFPIGLDPYPGQLHPDSQPRLSSFGEYISSSDSSSDLALTSTLAWLYLILWLCTWLRIWLWIKHWGWIRIWLWIWYWLTFGFSLALTLSHTSEPNFCVNRALALNPDLAHFWLRLGFVSWSIFDYNRDPDPQYERK